MLQGGLKSDAKSANPGLVRYGCTTLRRVGRLDQLTFTTSATSSPLRTDGERRSNQSHAHPPEPACPCSRGGLLDAEDRGTSSPVSLGHVDQYQGDKAHAGTHSGEASRRSANLTQSSYSSAVILRARTTAPSPSSARRRRPPEAVAARQAQAAGYLQLLLGHASRRGSRRTGRPSASGTACGRRQRRPGARGLLDFDEIDIARVDRERRTCVRRPMNGRSVPLVTHPARCG